MIKYPWILSLVILCFCVACKENKTTAEKENTGFVGANDEQLVAISALIEKEPLNAKLRYERAKMLHDNKYYDEAVADLRVAILQDSLMPEFYHLLSDVFMDNALSNKALQTIETAAHLFPTRIPTQLKLSETQLILQLYEKSISTLNEILRQDPQNAEAYFMLGLNFRDMGDERRAINSLKTATEFDSRIVDAWIILGNIYEAKNDKSALEYYSAAVNVDPRNPNALHSKAYYLQNHGDVKSALLLYDHIIAVDRDYTDAYLNAGILNLDRDSLQRAMEQFNILSGKSPQDWRPYYYRSLVYKRMGNKAAALADIQSCINLADDDEQAEQLKREIERM